MYAEILTQQNRSLKQTKHRKTNWNAITVWKITMGFVIADLII